MKFDIEKELKDLVLKCRQHNIKLTGALEIHNDEQSSLIGFTSTTATSSNSEEFTNIETLVNNRGNLDSFLMELSEQSFGTTTEDDRSIVFGRTNSQIFTTQH